MTKIFHILTSSFLVMALGLSSAQSAILVSFNHFINSPNFQVGEVCLQADNSTNSSITFARPCANTFNQVWNLGNF
jgi:hypothetical protein